MTALNARCVESAQQPNCVVYPTKVTGALCARADAVGRADRGGGVRCLNPWDCQSKRIFEIDGIYPTLPAMDGGGANNQAVIYPIHDKATRYKGGGQTRNNDGSGNGLGVGRADDPMYTATAADRHAVIYDARGNGRSDVAATLTGDHENRITDYTNIACYAQDRIGQYSEGEITSTQTARQRKSPTDLVVEKRRRYVVRRLTPLECARLQGFPDMWTDGVPGSDTAKYKMWGNGMALPCLLAVLSGIWETAHD